MKSRRHLLAFAILLAACVSCDQASKHAAVSLLADSGSVALAGDLVRFELAFNPGAFLGMGATLPAPWRTVLLLAMAPLLMALVALHVLRAAPVSRLQLAALALVCGGGLGNWIDRVRQDGSVTDFVSIGVGPLRTGIFNVADVALMGGMLLLVLAARAAGHPSEPTRR